MRADRLFRRDDRLRRLGPAAPGASILRQVALPLGLALLWWRVVSAISSRYAVRSARSLERALFAAKAADRSKTEFLSNVSHELRTPMNGILGVAQLLQTTELDDEQRELVAVLFASANAQMALISDLLDFSRMEGGNRQLVAEPFEPAAVLRDVAEMMRVAAGKKGDRLDCDWDALAGADRARRRAGLPADRDQPARQRREVHRPRAGDAARRRRPRRRPGADRRSGSPTPAAASRPRRCRTSSSASTRSTAR